MLVKTEPLRPTISVSVTTQTILLGAIGQQRNSGQAWQLLGPNAGVSFPASRLAAPAPSPQESWRPSAGPEPGPAYESSVQPQRPPCAWLAIAHTSRHALPTPCPGSLLHLQSACSVRTCRPSASQWSLLRPPFAASCSQAAVSGWGGGLSSVLTHFPV